jgi:hypothetical protein
VFHAWGPCFNNSTCSSIAITRLRNEVMWQARIGIADRESDLLDGQLPHTPEIGT